jgi:hypothetical protein
MYLHRRLLGLFVVLAVALLLLVLPPWSTFATPAPANDLQRTWLTARNLGTYSYHTEIVQVTDPLPVLENVGLHSTEERYYLTGKVDVARRALDFKLWAGDGSALSGTGALELSVRDGEAFSRSSSGEWQPIDNASSMFAPGGDMLGYLSAAMNVRPGEPTERAGVRYTPYSFQIDGPAFALYMRDLAERELLRKGKLAPGARVPTSRVYASMTGSGELWVREDGLPLRQVITLTIPDELRPQQTIATITSDFSGYGEAPALNQITNHNTFAKN